MKKGNRLLAIIPVLALLMTAALAGCGGTGPEPGPEPDTAAGYIVIVTDEEGTPVPDVTIQFCSDTECILATTDDAGVAAFEQGPGAYTVHVLQVPADYAEDDTEYAAPEEPGLVMIVLRSVGTAGDTVAFETTDLAGNPVSSEALFAESKVTMINLWATWCGPCVSELPELGALAEEFAAQDCQIVGVCYDATDPETVAEAQRLLAEAGADYLNLAAPENVDDVLPTEVVPTTFFVDKDGNLLVDPVLGADFDGYRAALAESLELVG